MLAVTLAQVKSYLWITWTDNDIQLTAILDWVNQIVEDNVWDISQGEKTMEVDINTIKNSTITLNIINPTSITEVDWNDFSSKVNWTDYFIRNDWQAIIKDFATYYRYNEFWIMYVKFNAWYSTAPNSLIALVSNYVWYLYSQDNWKDIASEQLWPRWVSYEWNNQNWQNLALKKFKKWLNQFIPIALRIF